MGSRILSRSFSAENWDGNGDVDVGEMDSAMKVDQNLEDPDLNRVDDDDDGNRSDEEEDEGDPSEVAMVPMADILNARYQTANVSVLLSRVALLVTDSIRPSFSTKKKC